MKTLFRSRHQQQTNLLQRRTFLTALGLGIAAPLAFKMSRMAVAAPDPSRPTRLFIYFVPHGSPIEHYEPGDGMSLNTGEGILSPFEPFKKYLTVMRGVSINVSENHAAIQTVLTGSKDKTDSIDYLIAQQLGITAHVLGTQSYRANSPGPDDDSKLARHGAYVTPIQNPADAIDDLFAGLSSGATEVDPSLQFEADFRNEALTLTEGEVSALKAKLSGLTTEENRLQVHLDSLAALKASSSGGGTVSCTERPSLPTAEGMAGKNTFEASLFADIIDGHLEATANAFLCGSARIATLQNMHANAQIPMDFPGGPGIAKNHHDPISHSQDAAGRTEFAVCQRWFFQRLADKLLTVLDQPDPLDPAHTVLDNTTILTCTEIIDGNGHNNLASADWWSPVALAKVYNYMPWTIIGGGGGMFSGGRVVTMDGVDHRHILGALAQSMGASVPSVGELAVSVPSELLA